MLPPGSRISRAAGWGAFHIIRAKRLIDTPPWLTLLIHVVLGVAGGVVGSVVAVALAAHEADYRAASATGEDLIGVLIVGFVGGAAWTLAVAFSARWQFRKFEKKYGTRAPELDRDEQDWDVDSDNEASGLIEWKRKVWDRSSDNEQHTAHAWPGPHGEMSELDVETAERMTRLQTGRPCGPADSGKQ